MLTALRLLIAGLALGAPLLGYATGALAQVVTGEEHCVINVPSSDRLNVRSKPSAAAKVVTQHRYGDCGITVTGECQGSWCPIEDGHFSGWVNRKYVSMVSPALYCVTGVGIGDVLNLRTFPSTQSKVLKGLSRHQCDIAMLPYASGNWQKVRALNYEGWVNRSYLSGE